MRNSRQKVKRFKFFVIISLCTNVFYIVLAKEGPASIDAEPSSLG